MKIILVISFFVSCTNFLNAQAVTLDKSFADSGILIEDNTSIFAEFALQSNGKIIVAGPQGRTENSIKNFVLTRYNTSGSIDKSFGKKGFAVGRNDAQVFKIAINNADDIVAVGSRAYNRGDNNGLNIVRFKRNGDTDSTFGNNGTAVIKIGVGVSSFPAKIIIQPDEKILVCGYTQNDKGFLFRCLSNGAIDRSFAKEGFASWENSGNPGIFLVTAMQLQSDGKILVGYNYDSLDNNKSQLINAVYRYNKNGSVDTNFGDSGIAHFQSKDNAVNQFTVNDLAIQPDGKIVGSGLASKKNNNYIGAARLSTNGNIDYGFGNNGLQHIAFVKPITYAGKCALQSDGKLLIQGSVSVAESGSFVNKSALTRLNSNGSIDNDFGSNGSLITGLEIYPESSDILLQTNNKILLGGEGKNTLDERVFILARYNNNVSDKIAKTVCNTEKLIIIYPNPTHNDLQIRGFSANEKIRVTITDLRGNIKLQVNAISTQNKIDISLLKPGNYLMKIETNNSITSRAFIKE